MKIVCILFLIAATTLCVHADQQKIEAIQIVKSTGNHTLQYVKDNKLETILNNDEIKDRYIVVISIVGRIQTGKSTMLNFFLNHLRKTVKLYSSRKHVNLLLHYFEHDLCCKKQFRHSSSPSVICVEQQEIAFTDIGEFSINNHNQ